MIFRALKTAASWGCGRHDLRRYAPVTGSYPWCSDPGQQRLRAPFFTGNPEPDIRPFVNERATRRELGS